MTRALVTGTAERVDAVADALRHEGFETLTSGRWVPASHEGTRGGPISCYVQLPNGSTGVEGLIARVDAVAAVSPLLARDAAVVLVADDAGWDARQWDALRLLAEAAVAEHARSEVRVAVLGERPSAGEIAATAHRESAPGSGPSLADVDPDLSFADWRTEVFSLTGGTERTYFGWLGADGGPRVAILRGAVVSPLPPAAATTGPAPAFSWGDAAPSAHLLAEAVLADTLGAETRCQTCGGTGTDCSACRGRGLLTWVADLAAVLVEEVIGSLPPEGFELRVSDVASWIEGQRVRAAASLAAAPVTAIPA